MDRSINRGIHLLDVDHMVSLISATDRSRKRERSQIFKDDEGWKMRREGRRKPLFLGKTLVEATETVENYLTGEACPPVCL